MKCFTGIITAYWFYVVGYLYYFSLTRCFTETIMKELKKEIRLNEFEEIERKTYSWYAQIVGYFDGILYITAFLFNCWQFVGVWLAFKLAGRWESAKLEADILRDIIKNGKEKNRNYNHIKIINNALYNIFTIGNALCLIYAVIAWKTMMFLKEKNLGEAIIMTIFIILASKGFKPLIKKQTERLKKVFDHKNN